MRKKVIAIIVLIICGFIPLYSQNEGDFEVRQNADNTITIIGYNGAIKDVVIPSTLYGLTVTVIGHSAFMDKGLTSVVIPDTVTIIQGDDRNGAFSRNSQLSSVL